MCVCCRSSAVLPNDCIVSVTCGVMYLCVCVFTIAVTYVSMLFFSRVTRRTHYYLVSQ